ncbi:MAG: hypothetical protein AAF802_31200 [Planctomycetota bacterium]
MTPADLIWNRAAMNDGGPNPADGDTALAALLYVHGLVMNGGVLHAAETCSSDDIDNALAGYAFFGFDNVHPIFSDARQAIDAGSDLAELESTLDQRYLQQIPSDSTLSNAFEASLAQHPASFSPLQ